MLKVYFWSHTKRANSTALPAGNPSASFDCALKEPCSVTSPRVTISNGVNWNPSALNYCQIPAFKRYYYVTWTYSRGIWEAACSVDVLATYKNDIGISYLYVLRASAAYDGDIIDTLYPAKVNSTYTTVSGTDPFTEDPASGVFVIGVAGSEVPNYGSLAYYVMDQSNMLNLLMDLNTEFVTAGNNFSEEDAMFPLQKALIDPFSYIKSCIWYPLALSSMPYAGSLQLISIGGLTMPDSAGYFLAANNCYSHGSMYCAIPSHPQASSKGNYMNAAYRQITAQFPPFGTFEIDPTIACNYSNVVCRYHIDCTTGIAVADINLSAAGAEFTLTRIETRVGVPMQLSAVYQDLFNGALSLGRGLVSGIASAAMGNPFGTLSGVFSGVSDAVNGMRPVLESVGSNGSYASLYGGPKLFVKFIYQVDEDNDHNGRPLCKTRRPSDLGGYMLIRDGDVPIAGTRGEAELIRSYLENGFYYE